MNLKKGKQPATTLWSPTNHHAPAGARRRWAARRTVPLSNSRTAPTLQRERTCWHWPRRRPRAAPTSAACDRFPHSANANTYSLFLRSTTPGLTLFGPVDETIARQGVDLGNWRDYASGTLAASFSFLVWADRP
jgi:hypothetical protein